MGTLPTSSFLPLKPGVLRNDTKALFTRHKLTRVKTNPGCVYTTLFQTIPGRTWVSSVYTTNPGQTRINSVYTTETNLG